MIFMIGVEVSDASTSKLYRDYPQAAREQAVLACLRRYVFEHIESELDILGFEVTGTRAWSLQQGEVSRDSKAPVSSD